ncbi:ABC transporter related [Synechocystis sp. LKSZ1]
MPSQGRVWLDGQLMTGAGRPVPPEQRNTGMVFQDYALFPHLSVAENIAFGLKPKTPRQDKATIRQRIAEVLTLVGLAGLECRYPHELSGGQQQRIALARALAPQPSLILLDEPLSNLDVQVRCRLRHEIRHILKATGISAIFVTHDQEEAMVIADKIGVMHQGRLEQLGSPEEIYTRPASRFVAEFVTQANFLPAERQGTVWITEICHWELSPQSNPEIQQGEVMLREEEISLYPDQGGPVVIRDRQFLGREYRYCLETPLGQQLHARTPLNTDLPIGSRVQLQVTTPAPALFPAV